MYLRFEGGSGSLGKNSEHLLSILPQVMGRTHDAQLE